MVKIVKGEVGLESLPEKVKADIYGKVMLKFLERMVEDAKKTKEDNMERAFSVCYSRERGFYATPTRLGTATEVAIPYCRGDLVEMRIGTYHTHSTEAEFSSHDIYTGLNSGEVQCVGASTLREDRIGSIRLKYPVVTINCLVFNKEHPMVYKFRKDAERISSNMHITVRRLIKTKSKDEARRLKEEIQRLYAERNELMEKMKAEGVVSFGELRVSTSDSKFVVKAIEDVEIFKVGNFLPY